MDWNRWTHGWTGIAAMRGGAAARRIAVPAMATDHAARDRLTALELRTLFDTDLRSADRSMPATGA